MVFIKRIVVDDTAEGEEDALLRKQKRPSAKEGAHSLAIGMLEILAVDAVNGHRITTRDARRAGAVSVSELETQLTRKAGGTVYRVWVRLGELDPCIEPQPDARASSVDLVEIIEGLERLDQASPRGPWTRSVLELIAERPFVRASDLADSLEMATEPFKEQIQELLEQGLIISHRPGYELSPRGQAVLAKLSLT